MKVTFFHRKPRPNVNFSVENLFKQIRDALPPEVDWEVRELRYFSLGFLKRLYISLEAAFNQKGINHVTGDINFIAIFLRKKRTVLTILDVGFMKHPRKLARTILRYFWIVFPVRNSAVVTTISQSAKNELLKYVRIDPSRIKIIYVPIAAAFTPMEKAFNKSEPTILQIGTKSNKNVGRLVQALKGIPCKLEIVGEVNEALEKELKEANLKYTASKNLSNDQVLSKYQEADILAFVSTYEGFGMPIVEANAIGRVVVTSNILSMPEIAGNAAHLVDPFNVTSIRDGIIRVIEDDAYRTGLIQNGFKNRQRFDVVEIAQQYTEIYKSIELS
jgi:glycosyltransferase involved in cell wall biosynthesis